MTNTLYYGDNLDILRQHVPDESVDLVYLDPPFNSNANYNVLFKEQSGEASPAQIRAFTDTWEWTLEAERTYEQEIITNPGTPANVKEMISAFRQFIGSNAMMAYLVMMTPLSRAETNQAVWRSKSVPLGLRCSAKMSACDGCRREPLVAARLVESRRQGNRRLSAWWRLACSA